MYKICATKKLLDRVKQPFVESQGEPSTALGNWHATALFWKPNVALFVNDRTLLPVFVVHACQRVGSIEQHSISEPKIRGS